jgi:uncharacterized protein YjbI with pentapeptide repeats
VSDQPQRIDPRWEWPSILGGRLRRWRTWAYLGLTIAGLVLAFYGSVLVRGLIVLRNLLADPTTQDYGLELLRVVISGIGTLATIIGGVAVFWNIVVTREGQITERFAEATRQLGHTEVAVCTGGIYALERLAKDSPRDHWVAMEVLTSFVQAKSPRLSPTAQQSTTEGDKEPFPPLEEPPGKISECIQAAIAVLGRRDTTVEKRWQRLILRKTNLQQAYIVNANFDRVDLFESNLQKAYIRFTKMRQAYLRKVDLTEASLRDSRLMDSVFKEANLYAADFRGSDLRRADFTGAALIGADLRGVDLRGANLTSAKLHQANFRGADLRGASLQHAQLMGADMRDVKLENADLQGANLRDTKHLTKAQIHSAHHCDQIIADRTTKAQWEVPPRQSRRPPQN